MKKILTVGLFVGFLLFPFSSARAYHIFAVDGGGGNYERLAWDVGVFSTDNSLVCITDLNAVDCTGCSRCAHDGAAHTSPNNDTDGLLFVIDSNSGANDCDDANGPYASSGSDPYSSVFGSLDVWSSSITTWSVVNLSYVCSFADITLSAFDTTDDGDVDIVRNGVPVLNGLNEIVFDDTVNGDILSELGLDPNSVLGLGVPLDANGDSILIGTMINPISEVFILINQTPAFIGVSLPGTVIHEIGHTLGLAHSATVLNARGVVGGTGVPTTMNNGLTNTSTANVPTMFWAYLADDGEDATLEIDDIAAATANYPNPGPSTLGSISGTVLNTNGSPILGATVIAYNSSGKEIGVILGGNPGLSGNETGDYRIENVPPGTYRVILIPLLCDDFSADTCDFNIDSYLTDVLNVQHVDFTEQFFDNVTLESASQQVTVTAGNNRANVDFLNVSASSGSTGGNPSGNGGLVTLDTNSGACSAASGLPIAVSLLDWAVLVAPLALCRWRRKSKR